ncbi:MAG: hypothetical protein NTU56_14800 [Proteobacteria bacterium]|nr:hypothetical protein [Pseudomonadota bacterium]
MDGVAHIVLGLTAIERWGATRRLEPRAAPHHWFVLVGFVVMLVLFSLLMAISYRRHQQGKSKAQKPETFADSAERRGLSVRERQILLAMAMRSGLPHAAEIFHDIDALNRGMTQLLAECAQTRTAQEIEDLKAEIARIRRKLGFDKASAGRGGPAQEQASSRDIPVGAALELTGRSAGRAVTLRAEVLRNDEMEMAVALPAPLDSNAGDSWLARYCAGMSAWEFRTATVSCAGQTLVLSHSGEVHFINRRRFERVAVHAPALLAHLPFLRTDSAGGEAPVFVESTVTELAGLGLKIETTLQVQVDDQILVVFRLTEGTDAAQAGAHTVAAAGRVKHGRDIERGVAIPDAIDRVWEGSSQRDFHAVAAGPLSIAVELTGLNNEEIEELASITSRLLSRGREGRDTMAVVTQESPAPVATAT